MPHLFLVLSMAITAALRILLPCSICVLASLGSSGQVANFSIHKGDEIVGHIVSVRTEQDARTTYMITSYSKFNVIFDQAVETKLVTQYADTAVVRCYSIVKLNDSVRDSSHLLVQDERSMRYVHPGPARSMERPQSWTTARMYYEEPVGRTSIFVESEMKDCPLLAIGGGRYTLTLPGGKVNHYLYKDGVLHEILVERGLVDLTFRRA